MQSSLKTCSRRFGVELEYNAFDGISRSKDENDLPSGIYEVGRKLQENLKKCVEITKWQYTNNNKSWHVKPDSSCGLEVCSPPAIPKIGLAELQNVVETLSSIEKLKSDYRCSFHVHVEIADFTEKQIVHLIRRWINFELFFFFITNPMRWLNQYCVPIGFSADIKGEQIYHYNSILHKFSESKYYAVNLYHYAKNKKKTIEFRIMGSEACVNSDDAINWCKLLLCFVERCRRHEGLHETTFEYERVEKFLDFLKLEEWCKEDLEFIQWLIYRLNSVIDISNLSGYDASNSFWKCLLKHNLNGLKSCVEKLESYLV